jgi:hypothetical protein
MFSLDNFYYIVYANLLAPVNTSAHYFYPFGSTSPHDLINSDNWSPSLLAGRSNFCLFYDQEPLSKIDLPLDNRYYKTKTATVLANSEHSDLKRQLCKENKFLDWYYFYHGFAALSWYRDYKYLSQIENKFTKVFINLNRLTTKDRSYRLLLVSEIMERGLLEHGHVSLCLTDSSQGTWQEELAYEHTKLSPDAKVIIERNLSKLTGSLVVDRENPQGNLSAHAGPDELKLNQSALWHVVSETIFYYKKLHLTEKIFKPIVSRRPFILVGAPGNLAYLKSYGFKTFDRWIDESYDLEEDNDKRIRMINDQLEKLCSLTLHELRDMHEEMKDVLEYNFNHFYGEFKNIIVDEMLENFKGVARQWNNGRVTDKLINLDDIDFAQVKKTLTS